MATVGDFLRQCVCSLNRHLPLLSMDHAELRRKLEQKVADLLAPPVEGRSTRTCCKSSFSSSNVFRQYTTQKDADCTSCDADSQVGNI